MANPEHIELIYEGAEMWNEWRSSNWETKPDLSKAQLGPINCVGAILNDTDLTKSSLEGADLSSAWLRGADLTFCDLRGTIISNAILERATLLSADLSYCDLKEATCTDANFRNAILDHADLGESILIGANRIYDKLLIVLSTNSMSSNWVELEIRTPESERGKKISKCYFPLALLISVQ